MSDKHGLSHLPMDLYTLGDIGPCKYRPGLGVIGCVKKQLSQLPAWLGGIWECQTNTVLSQLPAWRLGGIWECQTNTVLSQLPAWLGGIWVCQTNRVYYNKLVGFEHQTLRRLAVDICMKLCLNMTQLVSI